MSIELTNISKTFGNYQALRDVGLAIHDGELVALLGPLGLRQDDAAADHRRARHAGSGQRLADSLCRRPTSRTARPPSAASGFVFQHYALFRHMSVFENIAFGMRVRPRKNRPANEVIEKRVNELLRLGAARRPRQAIPVAALRRAAATRGAGTGAWRSSRGCCSWTSRSVRSTRRCGKACGPGCGSCTKRFTSRASS